MGHHNSASASRLLGLDGFEVLAAQVVGGEWHLNVETTTTVVGCMGCRVRAELHGRRTVRVRDLPSGGRPVVLWWRKRIWRCGEPACEVRTWTERVATISPRAVLTERARAEACRRVGNDAHAAATLTETSQALPPVPEELSHDLRVCTWTRRPRATNSGKQWVVRLEDGN